MILKKIFERQRSSICLFTPQMSATPGPGPGQDQEPGTQSHFLCGWQRPKYLNHHILPPRVHSSSRRLDWKQSFDSNSVNLIGDAGILSSNLIPVPNTCPNSDF